MDMLTNNMFTNIIGDDGDISENIEDLAQSFSEIGQGVFEATLGSSIPLDVTEDEAEKRIEAEIPFLSSNSVEVDSTDEKLSISVEKSSEVEGENIEDLKDTLENLIDFPEDANFSTMSGEMSEGVLEIKVDKDSTEDKEYSEEDEF